MNRSTQGAQNAEQGAIFEQRVAEIYRLMGYEVTHGQIFSGRQVDLILRMTVGDLIVVRAIECKRGPVRTDDLDAFINKLKLVRHELPLAQGAIVTGDKFTDATEAHAAREGVQLITYWDLSAKLFNGEAYAVSLRRDISGDERYRKEYYVEPRIGDEIIGSDSPAFSVISDWLDTPEWNQLTVLGDVGTGKSFLAKMIASRMAGRYLRDPVTTPLPVLVDLRNADRQFSLEGLMLTHFARHGLQRVSFEAFTFALRAGSIVLILDGFDEMSARVTPQVTRRNFHELARAVQGRAKVLLTCRTHYFKNRSEEEEVVFGGTSDHESDTARELYWDLISRQGFKIAYLRPFNLAEIQRYIRRVRPADYREAVAKIHKTYNLVELSQRPMLLEMIVKSIDRLNAPEINPATLYRVFTDAWIHRDLWREVLSPAEKLNVLTGLATRLWDRDAVAIHHSELAEFVRQSFATGGSDAEYLLEVDAEVRTASFLTRDGDGNYSFAHKSYFEYFVARHFADRLDHGDLSVLGTRPIPPEIFDFLRYMVKRDIVEHNLTQLITKGYVPLVSENALLCLYHFRRGELLDSSNVGEANEPIQLLVSLPNKIQLGGAQLALSVLDGAVMREANLAASDLRRASLVGADLYGADLSSALLDGCNAANANLERVSLHRASCHGSTFDSASLSYADLSEADFTDAFFIGADYTEANVTSTVWINAVLPDGVESTTERFWAEITTLKGWVLRVARLYGLRREDGEELYSEVLFSLAEPRRMEAFLSREKRGRQQYVLDLIRRQMKQLKTTGRTEVAFAEISSSAVQEAIESSTTSVWDREIGTTSPIAMEDVEAYLSVRLARLTFEIFQDRYVREYPIRDIAIFQGLSPRTVHRHLLKAREVARDFVTIHLNE
jgi:uncharacterized protein YjbI with pentapeptide repeats